MLCFQYAVRAPMIFLWQHEVQRLALRAQRGKGMATCVGVRETKKVHWQMDGQMWQCGMGPLWRGCEYVSMLEFTSIAKT